MRGILIQSDFGSIAEFLELMANNPLLNRRKLLAAAELIREAADPETNRRTKISIKMRGNRNRHRGALKAKKLAK
jgi:hypothetical protein